MCGVNHGEAKWAEVERVRSDKRRQRQAHRPNAARGNTSLTLRLSGANAYRRCSSSRGH